MFKSFTNSAVGRTGAIFIALSALAAQTPAYASNGCYGCNVIDRGEFTSIMRTQVYYQGRAFTAVDIDRSTQRVFLLNGRESGWVSGSEVYSPTAQRERNQLRDDLVTGGTVILFACMLGLCENSRSAGSAGPAPTWTQERAGQNAEYEAQHHYLNRRQ